LILFELDYVSVSICARTCKTLNEMIDQMLWRKLFERDLSVWLETAPLENDDDDTIYKATKETQFHSALLP